MEGGRGGEGGREGERKEGREGGREGEQEGGNGELGSPWLGKGNSTVRGSELHCGKEREGRSCICS